jgi:predicted nucleic acid-binding protein
MVSRLLIIVLLVLAKMPVDAATTLKGVILANELTIQLLDDEKLRQSVAETKKSIEQQQKIIEDAVQAWLLKAQLLALKTWVHQIAIDGRFGLPPLRTSDQVSALHPSLVDWR